MAIRPQDDEQFQAMLRRITGEDTPVKVSTPKSGEVANRLADYRVRFFWWNCFGADGLDRFIYKEYANYRDTPEAQRFLAVNPTYFIQIDRILCQQLVAIRKRETRS